MSKSTVIKKEEEYIFYKRLYVGESRENVYLLGYKLPLTRTEHAILRALILSRTKSLTARSIAEKTGLELSKANVAYHVSGINAKARVITERVLIKNTSSFGYFLNEEM